jgi:trimethylguanosine synthase
VFDLSKMEPYNLEKLYTNFSKYSKHVVLYLPRTSDLNQLARYAPGGKKIEVSHYCMMGASKVRNSNEFEEVTLTYTGALRVLWRIQL